MAVYMCYTVTTDSSFNYVEEFEKIVATEEQAKSWIEGSEDSEFNFREYRAADVEV